MFYLTYEDDNHPELNSERLFFTQKSIIIYTKVLFYAKILKNKNHPRHLSKVIFMTEE